MLRFEKENILNVRAEALVNSVNLKGVMGKGVALAFKNTFPENFRLYKEACDSGKIGIGKIFVTETGELFPKYIINFPTKNDWKHPSKYEYIEEGLKDLVRWLKENKIKSIGIPPLGSGNGRLEWQKVKQIITDYLSEFSNLIDIIIIEPDSKFDVVKLKPRKEISLTPARAMLLYLMNKYRILGYEINFLVVQKLAYFLQRFNEPLKLKFEKGFYGPFANNLMYVLDYLNNSYISFNHDHKNKPTTIIRLKNDKTEEVENYVNNELTNEQINRLNKVLELVNGFETPFGLELLGTIDFIQYQRKDDLAKEEILSDIKSWTQRKEKLIKPAYVAASKKRLSNFFTYN